MHTQFYLITPLSNLHVGSGDVSVGVIDNLIQRDVLTDFPNINASSLKGAIREYCKYNHLANEEALFGSDHKETKKTKGTFRFFDANLLAIPVRSDKTPYLMATSIGILKEFVYKLNQFGVSSSTENIQKFIDAVGQIQDKRPVIFNRPFEHAIIEELDYRAEYKEGIELAHISGVIEGDIALLSDNDMRLICDNNHLPVIARNHLENGTSANLWYEQVLPRYSQLYFTVVSNSNTDFESFDNVIQNSPVSIGANASIGYGYCKITKLTPNEIK